MLPKPESTMPLGEILPASRQPIPRLADRSLLLRRTAPVVDAVNDLMLINLDEKDRHGMDPHSITRSRFASKVAQLALIAGGLTTGKNPMSPDNISLRFAAKESTESNTMTVMSTAGSKLVIATFDGFGANILSSPIAKEGVEMPTGDEMPIVKALAEYQEGLNQEHGFQRPPFDFDDYQDAYRQLTAQ